MLENLKMALWKYRRETGLRQGRVGLKCDITETEMSRIIYLRIKPTDDQRKALAEILGQPEEWLFTDPSLQKSAAATASKS